MSINCDNCNKDLTPGNNMGSTERHIIFLNGGKKCLCTDCFIVLSDWACSDNHKVKVKEYQKNFEQD